MTTKSASPSAAKAKPKKKVTTVSKAKKPGTKTTTPKSVAAKPAKSSTVKDNKQKAKTPAETATTKNSKSNGNGSEKRTILIQQMAYYIAEERGFSGGDPVQDWLAAERKVDQMLKENRL